MPDIITSSIKITTAVQGNCTIEMAWGNPSVYCKVPVANDFPPAVFFEIAPAPGALIDSSFRPLLVVIPTFDHNIEPQYLPPDSPPWKISKPQDIYIPSSPGNIRWLSGDVTQYDLTFDLAYRGRGSVTGYRLDTVTPSFGIADPGGADWGVYAITYTCTWTPKPPVPVPAN